MIFKNSISENVQLDIILVSFDVTNLYSNITHELGLEAIVRWIDKFPYLLHDRFSKPLILQSLKFILEQDSMNCDGIIYKQNLWLWKLKLPNLRYTCTRMYGGKVI